MDFTPYQEQVYYGKAIEGIGHLDRIESSRNVVRAGWAKENITPKNDIILIGYSRKVEVSEVRDSLFVRSLIFEKDGEQCAVLSFDLLLCHASIADGIREKAKLELPEIDHFFFSCSHTHNGTGGWGKSLAGKFLLGSFDDEIAEHIIGQSILSLKKAIGSLRQVELSYNEINCQSMVTHRIWREGGETDPFLRVLKMTSNDGETAYLHSFAAHPTCINPKEEFISADYPGALNATLEESDSVGFSIFLAGAMASHKPVLPNVNYEFMTLYGKSLADSILLNDDGFKTLKKKGFGYRKLEVPMAKAQLKVWPGYAVRSWLFNSLFGDIRPSLDLLQIGELCIVGTPADFSGELYSDIKNGIKSDSVELMICGFNGEYIGYVIHDDYYLWDQFEARDMSWFGPYQGAYFTELISGMVNKCYAE